MFESNLIESNEIYRQINRFLYVLVDFRVMALTYHYSSPLPTWNEYIDEGGLVLSFIVSQLASH